MKNRKIHPSPAASSESSAPDVSTVLKLLPAAILALTVVMGVEDKEVVAYLIMRSINGPVADVAAEERRMGRRKGPHRALFDCGCFECYTSFWSRWDGSPDRELIHRVIEEFEEHLARAERREGRGRRRDRRAGERSERIKSKKAAAEAKEVGAVEEEEPLIGAEEADPGEVDGADEVEKKSEAEEVSGSGIEIVVTAAAAAAEGGERRKGWADLVGMFNSRLLSLWGPGV